MKKHMEKPTVNLSGIGLGLDELVRDGARHIIRQAIEAEVSQLLEQFGNVRTLHCRANSDVQEIWMAET